MKIYTTEQIRAWDAYTIEYEPIASVALMNRAAEVFVDWLTAPLGNPNQPVWIIAGTGNNGGDGVAVARLLQHRFYPAKVFVCDFDGKHSPDFDAQIDLLPPHDAVEVHWLKSPENLPAVPANVLLVDALFGSGLTRPLGGAWAQVVDWLNGQPNETFSIDLPSGLFADRHTSGPCVHADRTFSFETPKRAFFFPENADRVGEWAYGSIGLHPEFLEEHASHFNFLTQQEASLLVKKRPRFSHKGTYGHALLLNGSFGSMGAAVLAAEACLRAGAGLLTVHLPRCGYEILQTRVPEALCSTDTDEKYWTDLPPDLARYSAIGAGCGIGQETQTAQTLKRLLQKTTAPLVLDADALNLFARHPNWIAFLPKNTIMTPHPKEFERLFGPSAHDFERNELQRVKAQELGVFLVLKGAYTTIATPDGSCWFNSTGNPGMATGGSGDVLTGILTGLLAQGYPPLDACLLGVFLHGLAGDLAAAEGSEAGMVAGDIVRFLGKAWLEIEKT